MGSRVTDLRSYIEKRSERIPFAGCWLWTGALTKFGYGSLGVMGRRGLKAHRVSFSAFHGPIPEGMCICHTCDVRSCVNPNHLYAGTMQDNINDRERRGRSRYVGPPKALSCKYGHPTTEPGSRTKDGGCRACRVKYIREYMRKWRLVERKQRVTL